MHIIEHPEGTFEAYFKRLDQAYIEMKAQEQAQAANCTRIDDWSDEGGDGGTDVDSDLDAPATGKGSRVLGLGVGKANVLSADGGLDLGIGGTSG